MHATPTTPDRSRYPFVVRRDDVSAEEWEDMLDARDEAMRDALADHEAGLDRPDVDEW